MLLPVCLIPHGTLRSNVHLTVYPARNSASTGVDVVPVAVCGPDPVAPPNIIAAEPTSGMPFTVS
jgi:hypothetical protein